MLLWLWLALSIKHFLADFPLQSAYQYRNKGIYLHLGGILHALIHGVMSAMILVWYDLKMGLIAGVIDALVHYHIDWAKVRLSRGLAYQGEEGLVILSNRYFLLLGLDQLFHTVTYIVLVWMIVR